MSNKDLKRAATMGFRSVAEMNEACGLGSKTPSTPQPTQQQQGETPRTPAAR